MPDFEHMDAITSKMLTSPIIIQPGRSMRHLPLSMRGEALAMFREPVKARKSAKSSADSAETYTSYSGWRASR